jgi:acyl-coenzyme A synthetase/AMP-(fatty) acid ligase
MHIIDGRQDTIIKSRKNVDPMEIEKAINEHRGESNSQEISDKDVLYMFPKDTDVPI